MSVRLLLFISFLFFFYAPFLSYSMEGEKQQSLAAVSKLSNDKAKKTSTKDDKYKNITLFSKILRFIEEQYVHSVDTQKILHGAIKGMLANLDPHSGFLNKEVYRRMKNDTSGKFGGIGVEIWLADDGLLTILHPIKGTPAWKAGILSNDKIIKINDTPTKGLSLIEAVTKMQGKVGESIKLTVYREKADLVKTFKLRRTIIKVKSVSFKRIDKDYAYIRLNHFQERSSKEIKKTLKKIEKKGPIKGLVLDLRNNPGGLLDEAVEVANLFIDHGVIVSTIGRDKKKKDVRRARSGIARKNIPIAVLVNGNSASAAEIVAGALKDHNRALILGTKTFGKGSVQTLIPLGDDLGLRLTVALYYTPNGTSIQEEGVSPHIYLDEVDLDVYNKAKKEDTYTRESGLQKSFRLGRNIGVERSRKIRGLVDKKKDKKRNSEISPDTDYQVQQALNYLKSSYFFEQMKNQKKFNSDKKKASLNFFYL